MKRARVGVAAEYERGAALHHTCQGAEASDLAAGGRGWAVLCEGGERGMGDYSRVGLRDDNLLFDRTGCSMLRARMHDA